MNESKFYEKMYLIRQTEHMIEKYFEMGQLRGTTHGYIGQEAIAVGVLENIDIKRDFVTSGHRCHGHYLAITEDVFSIAAELMGKEKGIVQGKGASQHIQFDNFYTNGITGGMIPIAVGLGLAEKLKGTDNVVISFLGDGAMNEGYVMEALNLSRVYQTPNIFILENNQYAMSTETSALTGTSFENRVKGFGLRFKKYKVLDIKRLYKEFKEIYNAVKDEKMPYFIEYETFRFCGHSKSDKKEYFNRETEKFWKEKDPLKTIEKDIEPKLAGEIRKKVDKKIEEAFKRASEQNEANPRKVLKHVED